jgi:WD40 repeat protein
VEIKVSWSEEYLAVAGVDGLIELYNMSDFSLYDNDYQRQGSMFFHDHPIQQLEFNYQDEMLASLDSTGLVNIWNLQNGKLLRKIDK